MYDVILSMITAFTLTYLAIPSIIHVAEKKNLMDEPGDRHAHKTRIPTLGGIGIFAGVIFSIVLWTPFDVFQDLQYILCAFIIIFLIGAKDDILPMSPFRKLMGQIFAAALVVFKAQIRLTSLYGLFGVYDIPYWASILLSVFTILVIINAFNLIDGINGLSGSISTLIALVLGTWFMLVDQIEFAIIAFALAGSVIAFLKYNFTPARIFMGDTGALLIGLICSILAIKFIDLHQKIPDSIYAVKSAPAVAIGILILPLFDTLRVFVIRTARGRSPMTPDRNHIHHLLLDSGLNHMQATSVLIIVNLFFILLVVKYQALGNLNLLILLIGMATILTSIPYFISRRKNQTINPSSS